MKKLDQIITELKEDIIANNLNLSEKEENFIKFIFGKKSQEKNIEKTIFMINTYVNSIIRERNNKTQNINFYTSIKVENIDVSYTELERKNIIKVLKDLGYLNEKLVMEYREDESITCSEDDEDYIYITEELLKSEEALTKTNGDYLSEEYKKLCGKIYHPFDGETLIDPLKIVSKEYFWTDKLKTSPEFIRYSKEDELEAFKTLTSLELQEKVKELALILAEKKLTTQD